MGGFRCEARQCHPATRGSSRRAQLGTRLRITALRLHDGLLVGYAFTSPFPADTPVIDFGPDGTLLRYTSTANRTLQDVPPTVSD